MARKRSLKDAAADQLVEKNKDDSVAPAAPVETAAAAPSPVEAAPAEPAVESAGTPLALAESLRIAEGWIKRHPNFMWAALFLLIGFAAGFFFGVGRALGPANMAYLVIGLLGGYLFGRFYKIV